MAKSNEITLLDIREPEDVQVEANEDGTVLWINVDGICRLRVTDPSGIKMFYDTNFWTHAEGK